MQSVDLERLLTAVSRFSRLASRRAQSPQEVVTGRLLSLVEQVGPVRVSDLAVADQTTQPTMTSHTRRLVDAGLLCREPDPADARASLLSLSPRGREVLRDIRRARAAAVAPLLAGLDAADLDALARTTEILDRVLATAPEVTPGGTTVFSPDERH